MKNLGNYCYKRNWKEAIVFYLVHLLIVLVIAGVFGGLVGLVFAIKSPEITRTVGSVIGLMYALTFYIGICYQKRLYSLFYILLGIVAIVVNLLFGVVGSLVFVAFLTTRECNLPS